jgi:hypothetical protein
MKIFGKERAQFVPVLRPASEKLLHADKNSTTAQSSSDSVNHPAKNE